MKKNTKNDINLDSTISSRLYKKVLSGLIFSNIIVTTYPSTMTRTFKLGSKLKSLFLRKVSDHLFVNVKQTSNYIIKYKRSNCCAY
jgi:hypothetical protein